MKWVDYREKLGIGFEENSKYEMLRNKIFAILPTLRDYYSDESYTQYIIMVCEPYYDNTITGIEYSFNRCTSIKELISKYIAFYNTYSLKSFYNRYNGSPVPERIKESLLMFIQKCLDELNIPFELFEDEDGHFIFPKGVKEFDDALASEVLDWLKDYQTAEKAWSKALREYAEANPHNASDAADKLRKALEIFFKEFFNNNKTLENNKAEYGRYLKNQGVPSEIGNNLETLLQAYTNYMNGYAKHHDKTQTKVLEYLMYQTGNIMRLLITLKQEETKA